MKKWLYAAGALAAVSLHACAVEKKPPVGKEGKNDSAGLRGCLEKNTTRQPSTRSWPERDSRGLRAEFAVRGAPSREATGSM